MWGCEFGFERAFSGGEEKRREVRKCVETVHLLHFTCPSREEQSRARKIKMEEAKMGLCLFSG